MLTGRRGLQLLWSSSSQPCWRASVSFVSIYCTGTLARQAKSVIGKSSRNRNAFNMYSNDVRERQFGRADHFGVTDARRLATAVTWRAFQRLCTSPVVALLTLSWVPAPMPG